MPRISFNPDDAEPQHLAAVARQTSARAHTQQGSIIAAMRDILDRAMQARLADFVKERYSRLRAMLEMVTDAQWQLREEDRQRVMNALACFCAPTPSRSPVTLLEHAVMIELVSRDLRHDLDAHRDFCRFREAQAGRRHGPPGADRERWLSQEREALQTRMHRRRRRELAAAGSSLRGLLSLLHL